MKKKNTFLLGTLATVLLTLIVSVCCLTNFNDYKYAFSINEPCIHDGYHYSFKKPTILSSGYQEFWTCCKCHEQWLNKPTVGTFVDKSKASIESTHVAYIPKIEGNYNFEKSSLETDYYVYLNSNKNVILDDPVFSPSVTKDRKYRLTQQYINENNIDGNVMAQISIKIIRTYSNDASIWYINQAGTYSGVSVEENTTVVIYANIYQDIIFRNGLKGEITDVYFPDPYLLLADKEDLTKLYGTYHSTRNADNCISYFSIDFDGKYDFCKKVGFSGQYIEYLRNSGVTSITANLERTGDADLTRLIFVKDIQ